MSEINEIWKKIEGYENYEVSNMGRVRSLNYNGTGKMKIMRPGKKSGGYLFVCLYKNGKVKQMYIHRVVAEAFLPNPDNLPCINHKNEIKTDNRVQNLEFVSHKYNINYSRNWEGAVEVRRKPVLQYTKTGELIGEYKSMMKAQRQTGINQSNISSCCAGKRKSAGNYIWIYKKDE